MWSSSENAFDLLYFPNHVPFWPPTRSQIVCLMPSFYLFFDKGNYSVQKNYLKRLEKENINGYECLKNWYIIINKIFINFNTNIGNSNEF